MWRWCLYSTNAPKVCLQEWFYSALLSRVVSVDSVHLFMPPFFSFPFAFCLLRLIVCYHPIINFFSLVPYNEQASIRWY